MALTQTAPIEQPKKPATKNIKAKGVAAEKKKITTTVNPNASQPAKQVPAAAKKSTTKKLAPAEIKPADVPKTKQVTRGTKVANSNLNGAVERTDAPPVKAPYKPRVSSTTKITRGVSDVVEEVEPNNNTVGVQAEKESLASIEEARDHYAKMLANLPSMFKPIAIPDKDIDLKTDHIREDSATERMNRMMLKVREIVLSQVTRYVNDFLSIGAGAVGPVELAQLDDLLFKTEITQEVARNLAREKYSVFAAPKPLHHTREDDIHLPGFSQETRTLFSGIRAVLMARTATEGDYAVLARQVELLKMSHPALSVWIEYRLKRVLAGKTAREEVAVALIDTLLSLGNVRICSTSSGRYEKDVERISYLAMWWENDDPGVVHYARLSSDNQTTFALTGQKNVERFTPSERAMLFAMLAANNKHYPTISGTV